MDSVISSSPPLLAHAGDQWTDSYGRQFVYVMNSDGTHGQWVQVPSQRSTGGSAPVVTDAPIITNPTPKITSSHLPPMAPNPNDLWFDTLTGFFFIWYWDGNTYQWVVTNPGRGSDVPPPATVVPVYITPDLGITMVPNPITGAGSVGVNEPWIDNKIDTAVDGAIGALPAYLPLTGGTLTGQLNSTTALTGANAPPINVQQTWNNAATVFEGIKINITDTASSGLSTPYTYNYGGVNRFQVNRAGSVISQGNVVCGGTLALSWSGRGFMTAPADGIVRIANNAQTDFTRLQFGGGTTAFPAIKKNTGPAINFRDATDVSDIDVTFKTQTAGTNNTTGATTAFVTSAVGAVASLPPTGAASGDLSGAYPNPIVIKASGAFNVVGPLNGTTASMSGAIRAQNATVIPAGGAAGTGFTFSATAGFGTFFGSGAPTMSAAQGSLYLRSDGGGPYVNTNGTTAWSAIGGGASVTVSDTAPGSPTSGALWWNSTLGQLFIWYVDPNTSQWVPTSVTTAPPEINVANFRLTSDGVDDAPSFARAAAAAAAAGAMKVKVPAGTYNWNSSQTFTQPVLFVGDGWNERQQVDGGHQHPRSGTWILVNNPAINPIVFAQAGPNNTPAPGLTGFRDIAFEQVHPAPGPGWAPTVYQPLIILSSTGGQFILEDVFFYNIYYAVLAPDYAGTNGRITFGNVKGQIFYRLFDGDLLLDMVYMGQLHIWSYWSYDSNVVTWQQANGIPIHLRRCDGLECSSFFAHGYNAGIWLDEETAGALTGSATNIHFNSAYIEFTKYSLHVTGTSSEIVIDNLITHGGSVAGGGSIGIFDESATSRISIGTWHLQTADLYAAYQSSTVGGGSLYVGTSFLEDPNNANTGVAVFKQAAATNVSVMAFASQPSIYWHHPTTIFDRGSNNISMINGSQWQCNVAQLPSAAAFYQRATKGVVLDALSPVFGSTVVGGGARIVPVYTDGTNWIVG